MTGKVHNIWPIHLQRMLLWNSGAGDFSLGIAYVFSAMKIELLSLSKRFDSGLVRLHPGPVFTSGCLYMPYPFYITLVLRRAYLSDPPPGDPAHER